MRSLWTTICLAGLLATPDRLSGPVRVIDGDTIVMGVTHIRLFGMDAFEHDQTCGAFQCGAQATRAMRDLTHGQTLTCEKQDIDPYGRTVAICKLSSGLDLGREMVRRGLAVDYRHFSTMYLTDEAAARKGRIGAWCCGFQSPEDFRRSHPHG